MANRLRYRYDPESVLTQVLIIWPQNRAEHFVYCPPVGDELPWIQEFADYDEAIGVASHLIAKTGQRHVQLTRDSVTWWLTGLKRVD
ncbi:hypothetical protein CO731_05110 [Aminobacter sp. MSH1]|nr:hypothetical protein CO731_00846 [Aminobacter sp. MSH1]AWC25611.1 hypothetical protein CO731_05110 [Aminobacter sp. MSH1]